MEEQGMGNVRKGKAGKEVDRVNLLDPYVIFRIGKRKRRKSMRRRKIMLTRRTLMLYSRVCKEEAEKTKEEEDEEDEASKHTVPYAMP